MGFYVSKQAEQFINTNDWAKLDGWAVTDVYNGPYNFDSQLENQEYVQVPITGIYYVTASVPLEVTSLTDEFSLALVNNDDKDENQLGLKSSFKGLEGSKHTLTLAGFVKVFAGERLTLQLKSVIGTTVYKSATFTVHFIGPPGAVPAYLGQVDSEISVTSTDIIKPFIVEGRAKLYRSLSGIMIKNLLMAWFYEFITFDKFLYIV